MYDQLVYSESEIIAMNYKIHIRLVCLLCLGQSAYAVSLDDLPAFIHCEDDELNALAKNIYADCIFGKLNDPLPPALPNPWFSPGGGYVGQWVWDTMFVLIAYAPLNDDQTIRKVFDNYWYTIDNNPEAPKGSVQYGMVPNFLKDWPPLGYSQIPILAWGCWSVAQQTNDRELLSRCLPYLITFDEWYSTERDIDNDGLIEFGAYKSIGNAGMLQTARYETFDFHPPMDDMVLTVHPNRPDSGAWYGNVEGVEQTCFLLMSERAIAAIANELNRPDIAARYETIIERRVHAIQEKMWDSETNFFYSLDRDSDRKIPIRTIQGFLTLTAGAATPEQAEQLVEQLRDPRQWWCSYPITTVALNDAKFDPQGFWRGDIWPPATYLATIGLNAYGYYDLSREITDRMLVLAAKCGVNERYNAATGQALGVPGLGMSCSIWSMVVQNIYGIQDDYQTIRIPRDAQGRRINWGKLKVAYLENGGVEVQTEFERRFNFIRRDTPLAGPYRILCDGRELSGDAITGDKTHISLTAEPGKVYQIVPRENP